MIVTKKKICAGYNGVEHEAYIYKNINGKKYCKSCTFKLQPPKTINKMSEKAVFKMTLKKELLDADKKFYVEVWISRFFKKNPNVAGAFTRVIKPCCEVPGCLKELGDEPNLMYFHHILEKRNYPILRHERKNIAIVCPECHNLYETFPDKVPYLKQKRDELLRMYPVLLMNYKTDKNEPETK